VASDALIEKVLVATRFPRTRQRQIGLGLAGALIGAWLLVHAGAMAGWRAGESPLWLAVLLVAVQTWLSTGLFIVAHDAMHGSLAPGRPDWNRRLGSLCLMLYAGLSYRRLLVKHAAHHRHAGSARDPDFDAGNPRRLLPWFARFFRAYYTHAQIVRIGTTITVYLLVLGVPVLNVILFWAVPALLALAQLFVFGTYLPHRHEVAPFADHHRARSSPFSPALSLLTCFHFGGYHHEHHLSPGTPWWGLPSLRRAGRGRASPQT